MKPVSVGSLSVNAASIPLGFLFVAHGQDFKSKRTAAVIWNGL